jgi:hypothetical protein
MATSKETFDPGDGSSLPYFYHPHNCGVQASRRTERTVELSIADRWMRSVDLASAVELGAVTPYYWPGRVARVIDPADPKATERASLFDVDFAGRDVLSISTIEHIGERRSGLSEVREPTAALVKIAEEAARLLVTFPTGMKYAGARRLEAFVLGHPQWFAYRNVSVRVLARRPDETWAIGEPLPYGDRRKPWANAVIVLDR